LKNCGAGDFVCV